ncbi:MAG: hypothetical protein ABR898_16775 [Terracidiphilus sp.]
MEPLAKEKTTITLDLKDPFYGALSKYAGRIGNLLTAPAVRTNPDLAGSLDDFLGATYALIQAKQHDFSDRVARPIEVDAVKKRASQIAAGSVRTDGKWIAGFYFNDALFRTAAVYHRVLKIVVGGNDPVPALLQKAKNLFPHWKSDKLDIVHSQVNGLKHEPRGVHNSRTARYDDVIAAVDELLALIEAWWTTANAPSAAKPGTAPGLTYREGEGE